MCPCARKGHTAVVYDGAMFVFGGTTLGSVLGDFWMCHETAQAWRWTKIESVPADVRLLNHSAVYWGRAMWVFGGATGEHNNTSNTMYKFVFDERVWKSYTFPPSAVSPRFKHTAVVVGSTMVVIGGCGLVGPNDFARDSLVCDLQKVEWSLLQIDLPEEMEGEDTDSLDLVCNLYLLDLLRGFSIYFIKMMY